MEGIEECLSDSRMAVFMCNATDDPAREAHHVEQLMGKRVDGIIVTARRADRRARLESPDDVPVIYVFSQVEDPGACCLVPDDEGGAVLATRHLAGLGRQRIAHVTGPERFEAVRHTPGDVQRDRVVVTDVLAERLGLLGANNVLLPILGELLSPFDEAKPLAVGSSRFRHQLILTGELPLVRLQERNVYRAALIAFQRARPKFDEPLLTLSSYSFPSGHVLASTLLYGLCVAWVFVLAFGGLAIAQASWVRSQRRDLVAVVVPQLGKSVDQNHEGAGPLLGDVHPDAVDFDESMLNRVHSAPSRGRLCRSNAHYAQAD
jgi:hypothetical protein